MLLLLGGCVDWGCYLEGSTIVFNTHTVQHREQVSHKREKRERREREERE